jgi:hypothetical protein
MQDEDLGSQEREADEAVENEAQTPEDDDQVSDNNEGADAQAQADDKPDSEQKTASQLRRERRRAAQQRQREEMERTQQAAQEAQAEAKRLKDRLALYEPVDPNSADDYDAAIARNAAYDAQRKAIEADLKDAEARSQQSEQTAAERRAQAEQEVVKSFWEEAAEYKDAAPDLADKIRSAPLMPGADDINRLDRPVEVAYYLANNQQEMQALAQMNPVDRAAELVRLEARIPKLITPKRASSAAAPLDTLSGNGARPDKDPSKMSYSEYRLSRGMKADAPGYLE